MASMRSSSPGILIPGLLLLALGAFLLADLVLRVEQPMSRDSGGVEVFLVAAIIPILVTRARLKLDAEDPFRPYAGDHTYALHHANGLVECAPKMSTSNVVIRERSGAPRSSENPCAGLRRGPDQGPVRATSILTSPEKKPERVCCSEAPPSHRGTSAKPPWPAGQATLNVDALPETPFTLISSVS